MMVIIMIVMHHDEGYDHDCDDANDEYDNDSMKIYLGHQIVPRHRILIPDLRNINLIQT